MALVLQAPLAVDDRFPIGYGYGGYGGYGYFPGYAGVMPIAPTVVAPQVAPVYYQPPPQVAYYPQTLAYTTYAPPPVTYAAPTVLGPLATMPVPIPVIGQGPQAAVVPTVAPTRTAVAARAAPTIAAAPAAPYGYYSPYSMYAPRPDSPFVQVLHPSGVSHFVGVQRPRVPMVGPDAASYWPGFYTRPETQVTGRKLIYPSQEYANMWNIPADANTRVVFAGQGSSLWTPWGTKARLFTK